MKKISLFIKKTFHICNIGLILVYLFPGSIFGWLIYDNIQKQPQLASDFTIFTLFSANHVYAFMFLSLLGLFSYCEDNVRILFLYLFFVSIFLELCHIFIPVRSFEYKDLTGNLLGVFLSFLIFYLFKILKRNK